MVIEAGTLPPENAPAPADKQAASGKMLSPINPLAPVSAVWSDSASGVCDGLHWRSVVDMVRACLH